MKIKSFAKINLGLEVIGKRPDGYHDIVTLFQSIDLADTLEFFPLSGRAIAVSGDDASIPWDETNLVYRAAALLQRETNAGCGVKIEVSKVIPAGKGLGGGSSNAAMTLRVLNTLWETGLDRAALIGLGQRLGADVPFFLEGGFCLGQERGDSLAPLPDLPTLYCLLVFPPFLIATADIYRAWLPSSTNGAIVPELTSGTARRGIQGGMASWSRGEESGQAREMEAGSEATSYSKLTLGDKPSKIKRFLESKDFGLLENQLEETIFRFYPQLEEYKRFFLGQGAETSLVSGTGSAVFGLFLERGKALRGWRAVPKSVPSFLAVTLSRKEYEKRLRAGV